RTEVEKKLARLLEVQIGTSQLFLRARGAFTIANTAISEVGGAWNGSGFTTGTGSWRTGVETAFRDEDRGTMIRLSARGVTREQIDNMSGLGYSPQDLLEIFKSFGTEEDIQFFLYLMNLDGDSFAKAFAINPESLSDVMRLVLADYSLRLVTFEPDGSVRDTTLLEKFNNALLSAEHSNRNVQDGRLFRDIYLDMLYDGTAYLFYTTAINLAFIDFSASIYNELYIEMWHMYRSQHAMRNLWATQRILISEISRHTVNFESINAREMSMSNLSFSGWTPSFEVQHFSEGHLEMRTIDVTARIAHTGYDLDLGRILADLRRLQIAHDTRWATLAMNLLGTGAGMLFPGLGGVLTATDVMISLFGFGTTTVELTEAQQGIFMRMFGSGGRFNMEGDTLSRLDGRFEGISFEGIYNPIVIRSLHGWQTEGLGSWLDEEHIDFRRINDERTRNELSGNDNALRLLDGGFTLGSGPNDMSAYEFLRAIDDIEKVINIDGSRGVNLTLLWSNNVLGN
ncbi:MAG: hypothetical protein FWE25_11370, partial [Lachnospiraceae bacterium]|nr:hypothetical protein [Lachnospiraceae bacterium]